MLDTGCTSHIYNDLQRLTSKRRLRKGEVELRKGNYTRVTIVVLRVVNLKLISRYCFSLEEFYHILSIVKKIISVSYFDKMSYTLIIEDKYYSIYFGSKLIATTHLVNALYMIDVCSYNLQFSSYTCPK